MDSYLHHTSPERFCEPRMVRSMLDLGGGVLKQRVACHGRDKSKGYRTIILYREGDKACFVYGLSKRDRANLREDEETQFKKMARYYGEH